MRLLSRPLHAVLSLALATTTLGVLASTTSSASASASASPSAAQVESPAGRIFTRLSGAVDLPARSEGLVRRVDPATFLALHVDQAALAGRMARSTTAAPSVVALPLPEGGTQRFRIAPVRTMEDGLAAKHPGIRTYAGTSLDGVPSTVRLDSTISGIHASVVDGQDAWYVEPAYQDADLPADALYLSYRMSALPKPPAFDELLDGTVKKQYDAFNRAHRSEERGFTGSSTQRAGEAAGGAVITREYRLAMTTDPTYAQKVVPASIPIDDAHMVQVNEIVTAAKVTLVNRINQIYNADVAFNLVLIDSEDQLNLNTTALFSGTNGPCGAAACFTNSSDCSDVLDSNTDVVGQIVGADHYDIGHLSMGDGFGGVAYLGVVGEDNKGGGCTSLTTPYGDGFAIDFVAHEMGHQFSGNHTFDGVSGSCMATNRNAGTSVEPGSGTSVMAYAGICFSDDTQPHTDPYFSQRTQDEFTARATAARTSYGEQQRFVLRAFDGTDAFRLTFPGTGAGTGTTTTLTNGTTYTTAGVDAAITAVTGGNPTVSALSATGFTVTWSGTADYPTPTVDVVAGTFSGFGNALVNGGPGTNQGSVVATSANHAPVVVAPPTRTIPIQTPFELTGSGTDADGDPLTYLWEQNDIGAAAGSLLLTPRRVYGPLFRVFGKYAAVTATDATTSPSPHQNRATTSPTRTFPDIEQVIAGSTNAKTGVCPAPPATYTDPTTGLPDSPALECYSELLPMPGYLGDAPYVPTPLDEGFPTVVPPRNPLGMRFRLTGRDNGGTDGGVDGGVGYAEVVVDIDPTAGPFLVSSQGTATTVDGNAPGTITWDTARTDVLGLADDVSITLSTDGGRTYPYTLLASTPNDGSQAITWPNVGTSKARVKVAAVDNYFFDLNDADITINPTPGLTLGGNTPGTFTVQHSDAPTTTPVVTASSATVDGDAITATPAGLPDGLTLTRVSSSAPGVRPGTARFEVTGAAAGDAGTFPVSVSVTDGAATPQTASFTVEATREDATVTYAFPSEWGTTQGGPHATEVVVFADVAEAADGSLGGLTETTATFTDTVTGEDLCTGEVRVANDGHEAHCTFWVDLDGTQDRVYEISVALGGLRYTGATTSPSRLTVRYDPGVLVDGPDAATVQYSDAPAPTPVLTVSDKLAASRYIAATADGLPAGLTLERTDTIAPDDQPGTATYAVTGTVTDAPGTYPATITVDDGNHDPVVRPLTVTVTREDAAATYTGPTTVPAAANETSKTFILTARVDDLGTGGDDTTLGDVTTASVTFRDTATDTTLCADTPVTLVSAGVGSASCEVTAELPLDGHRTYQVALAVGGRYTGSSAADTPVRVEQSTVVVDTTAPVTTLTDAPDRGDFVLARVLTLGYSSSESPSTFTCSLNSAAGDCAGDAGAGSLTLRSLKPGSYDFSVAASDAAGNTDATSATTRFYVPVDDGALARFRGPWKHRSAGSNYRGDYTTVSAAGAQLRYPVRGATSLALVSTKGPGYGAVKVYLGKTLLRTVRLNQGSAATQVLSAVATFDAPTSGTVRIVTTTGKPVRIDGLGVRTRDAGLTRPAHMTAYGVRGL